MITLSDAQWNVCRACFRRSGPTEDAARRPTRFLDAVIYRLETGVPWRDLPERFRPVEVGLQSVCQLVSTRVVAAHF